MKSGPAKLASNSSGEIVLMQDLVTDKLEKGIIDEIFVLTVDNSKQTSIDVDLSDSDLININNEVVVAYSQRQGMWTVFSVNTKSSEKTKNELLKYLDGEKVFSFEGVL